MNNSREPEPVDESGRYVRGNGPDGPGGGARSGGVAVSLLLLLAACGKPSLTAPADFPVGGMLTPSGAVAVYPHTYGHVLPWHLETAEASWQHVAPCVGVPSSALRSFPVYLTAGPIACGDVTAPGCTILDANQRIEIIGASWDFDPARPEESVGTAEIQRLWRHEFVHVGLAKRYGDIDAAHTRPEWECER